MTDRSDKWVQVENVIMALTIWREASNQTYAAWVAIAHCIKNRVDRPSWWGSDIIGVCTKREQFTSMNTAQNDPNLRRWPKLHDPIFGQILDVVDGVLKGQIPNQFPGADSYYDGSIPMPWWAKQHPGRYRGQSGAFYFYDMDEDVETPQGPQKDT